MFDYKAENPDELQLDEGDVVKVLDKNLIDDGWWKGIKRTGEIGIFPSNFVREHQELHSTPCLKNPISYDCSTSKRTENVSIREQTNVSGSVSFNDLSIGGRTPMFTSPNKESCKEKISKFTFKTKNVYANSGSVDSLSDRTKSKHSLEILNRTQNTNFRSRPVNGHYESSKGDDTSNSLDKNFDIKTNRRSCVASPVNNSLSDYHLLKTEFDRFKQDVDKKISKLSHRIQTLIDEIDDEKKQRAASEIELVRLRRVVQMLDAQSLNGGLY